ncbi:MAG: hypothetical protein LBE65_00625 [Synergistaceae bacterium]|jgi:hypothetical protein|nr:hypothetical protein [Synergistaceae bacterium]
MFRIRYYYSSLAKQFFLVTLIITLLLRLVLFFAGSFYRYAFVGATVALYAFAVAACCFFLIAWKFFYTEFDENTVIWRDRIIGKEIRLDTAQITRAVFSKSGIFLYCRKSAKPCLRIPFRRFGVVSPVGVENFTNLMKNRKVPVELEYRTLPGYGPLSVWFGRIYTALSVLMIINSSRYAILIFLFLKSAG